MPLLKDETIKY